MKFLRNKWFILAVILLSTVTVQSYFKSNGFAQTHPKLEAPAIVQGSVGQATKEVEALLLKRYSPSQPLYLESVLSALGANAGYGCEMAIREGLMKMAHLTEKQAFVAVKTTSGQTYYFGDHVNKPLLESPVSVWSIVAGGAKSAGAKTLPNMDSILSTNAANVGTPAYGVPQLPPGHQPKELPLKSLQATWPQVRHILEANKIAPLYWGWVPALAVQRVIIENKARLEPGLAATIVMESATPMSKMDPAVVTPKHI